MICLAKIRCPADVSVGPPLLDLECCALPPSPIVPDPRESQESLESRILDRSCDRPSKAPDAPYASILLRPRRQRPSHRAPSSAMNWRRFIRSPRRRGRGTVVGISRPSGLAVFMLITNSYLVDASTGRSPGFSPLRMRSTYTAVPCGVVRNRNRTVGDQATAGGRSSCEIDTRAVGAAVCQRDDRMRRCDDRRPAAVTIETAIGGRAKTHDRRARSRRHRGYRSDVIRPRMSGATDLDGGELGHPLGYGCVSQDCRSCHARRDLLEQLQPSRTAELLLEIP